MKIATLASCILIIYLVIPRTTGLSCYQCYGLAGDWCEADPAPQSGVQECDDVCSIAWIVSEDENRTVVFRTCYSLLQYSVQRIPMKRYYYTNCSQDLCTVPWIAQQDIEHDRNSSNSGLAFTEY